jgi:hypothetical protein
MFFAALWSRSCRVPQDGHCHVRVFKLRSARRYPHAEHVLDDGYHRSTVITRRPYLAALYSIMTRKAPSRLGDGMVQSRTAVVQAQALTSSLHPPEVGPRPEHLAIEVVARQRPAPGGLVRTGPAFPLVPAVSR